MSSFLHEFIHISEHLLVELIPVFFIAIILSAIIQEFIPDDYFLRNQDKQINPISSFLNILLASLVGAILPICTCGTIPLALKLSHKGVNWRLTTAFLISGNSCNISAVFMTWKLISPEIAIFRLGFSILLGLAATYFMRMWLPQDYRIFKQTESKCCKHIRHHNIFPQKSIKINQKRVLLHAKSILNETLSNFKNFAPWILIATAIAAGMESVIDVQSASYTILKNHYLGPLIYSVVAFPLYLCSGTALPVSINLIENSIPIGSILSFMLASPNINITTFGIYSKAIGTKRTLLFLGSTLLFSIIFGIVLNVISYIQFKY